MGFISNLLNKRQRDDEYLSGFAKTKDSLLTKLKRLSVVFDTVDDKLLEELLIILLEADVGLSTATKIIDKVKSQAKQLHYRKFDQVVDCLLEAMLQQYLDKQGKMWLTNAQGPDLLLVVGVNGTGKTTSCAKLADYYQSQGKKVCLIAADTFRAGAVLQLETWANRIGIACIAGKVDSDPAAVVVDGIRFAKENNYDLIICDTAGRLQNKVNLMHELNKIQRVAKRELAAEINAYLVLDSTTGQNGLKQAEVFLESCPINGIVLTKMDGTAKGGIILAIKDQLQIDVKFVGLGEQIKDLKAFDVEQFMLSISEGISYE
jgi:fused signal recognition particle receptor